MSLIRIVFAAALAGLPAFAHHQQPTHGAYLASWIGTAAPPAVDFASGNCPDTGFWEKGFVSKYAQGGVGGLLR